MKVFYIDEQDSSGDGFDHGRREIPNDGSGERGTRTKGHNYFQTPFKFSNHFKLFTLFYYCVIVHPTATGNI